MLRHTLVLLALFSFAHAQEKPGVPDFDSSRDAAADIQHALEAASLSHKLVLLDIGGDWCPWCHALDQLFGERPDLARLRDTYFITVKVYYGPDNKNESVLSRYPQPAGIPHFFVLNADGTVLHSEHLLDLQTGGSYDAEKIRQFLIRWSKPGL